MMMSDAWIVIPGWSKFQHYPDNRGIVWVKDYLDQLDRDEYLELTFAQRGLLLDLRKLYARRRGLVRSDTRTLSRALTKRVTQRELDSLNHAGFIEIVASKPLALARSREEEEEEKKKKGAHARKRRPVDNSPRAAMERRANVVPADPAKAVEAMIRNRVITDPVDLAAEIAGYHLDQATATRLRGLLQ